MEGVSSVGATDAWALGEVVFPLAVRPLVEHWNGTQWSRVALPARVRRQFVGPDFLDFIGASSGGNVWAFTFNGQFLRLQGTHWTTGVLPKPGTGRVSVETVKVFSRTDVWVFGARVIGIGLNPRIRPYAARFNGSKWTEVTVPGRLDVNSVSAVSAHDMFAVTGQLASERGTAIRPHVLHWNGTVWRALPVQPGLRTGAVLYTVLAQSNAHIWIGGSSAPANKQTLNLVKHWNGHSWLAASPNSALATGDLAVTSLVPDGCRGIWGLAVNFSSGGLGQLWHRAGDRWSGPIRTHWLLAQLAAVRSTTSTWAVGEVKVQGHYHGVIVLHGAVPGRRLTVGRG